MRKLAKRFIIFWLVLMVVGVLTEQNENQGGDFFNLSNQQKINQLLQEISEYRHLGLISQLDTDMGDTLQRTGSYYTLLFYLGIEKDDLGRELKAGYMEDMDELTVAEGVYRRSNDPLYWGFDANNCSRDQIFAAQSAIVTFRDFSRGRALFDQFLQRGFLNQNTRRNWVYSWEEENQWKFPDIPTPSQLSLLLRGLGSPILYPAIFLLDSFIILDIKIFRTQNERELWDYDIKQFPALIAANSYLPTPWSYWGMKIYLEEKQDIRQRIYYYNQNKFNGIRPLAGFYDLALDKISDQINLSNPLIIKPITQQMNRQISSEK